MLAAKIDPLHTKPEIISGKSGAMSLNSRKKRYDELGNEINPNDKDIMNDIAQGHTIVAYHTDEDLNNKEDTYTVRR